MTRIPLSFFRNADVVQLSRDLLGKQLMTQIDGQLTGGVIIETEAYRGPEDKACHAYNNRRTQRTEVMFHAGGKAYVYLCYGIHHLLNFVTGNEDESHAVLIRAIRPTIGEDLMLKRRRQATVTSRLAGGPGTLTQALGITTHLNGSPLDGSTIWVEEGESIADPAVEIGPRVGIDYAAEWKEQPWRFRVCPIKR